MGVASALHHPQAISMPSFSSLTTSVMVSKPWGVASDVKSCSR
jgi:hypothetical protein